MPDLTPHSFVAKWRNSTLKERSASQEHFIDLCRLVGHPTPAQADPAGTWFTFDKGLTKPSGGEGFADVWKMGHFGWEYKGNHANLDKAYQQLLQYREDLLNPPLLVVADSQRIVVHTNFTNTVKRKYDLALDDLLKPEGLKLLRAVFTDPESLRDPQTPEHVTQLAAEKFARLSERLRSGANGAPGHPSEPTAHFLIRLLFCLFAEDAGILPNRLFTQLVTRWGGSPTQFEKRLRQLFAAMAGGGPFGAEEIPHVDGGLFEDDAPSPDGGVLPLDGESLRVLIEVSGLDWAAIEPSVLGTLFERSLDPGKRSQLGAHYTSKDDILLIVEPVLMAPLRREWAAARAQAEALAGRREVVRGAAPSPRRTKQLAKLDVELKGVIREFRERLAAVQVLDPACGSGSFLYVALRQMLDLEHEAINLAVRLGDSRSLPLVGPEQLHGIEINPYAYELAQATIWIGYIQWLRENGYGRPAEPILKPLQAIRRMDAVLAYDDAGEPVEPEWPAADVIIANPPFLGVSKQRSELGQAYMRSLDTLYGARLPVVDLVCYWFEKARAQIAEGKAKRAGLLATQAIRGGANRTVLERIKATGDIFWAESDRNWVLDGATVHVSMVGFDAGDEPSRELDRVSVEEIHANLRAKIDITQALRLPENARLSFSGTKKGGSFEIPVELASSFLTDSGNPNGKPNSDVVRPWINGQAIAGRDPQQWIIDFGVNMTLEEASMYERPFEYIRERVLPEREKNNRERRRVYWWLHAEVASGLRGAIRGLKRYIATPRVSKHRIFIWVPATTLPDDGVFIFPRNDNYFLGILHSRLHELWARAMGTQLREAESGFRYTPSTTFETYPFPWPPGKEPVDDPRVVAIADAARDLVAKRDAWLNPPDASEAELKKRTLTNLYNARPEWLKLAHGKLDEAVLAAYGWPAGLTDEEILSLLLTLNLERAG